MSEFRQPVYTLKELMKKQVINIYNGKCLGYFDDAEVDVCTGRIIYFCIHVSSSFFCFGKDEVIKIFWEQIEKIGEDAILVKSNPCKSAQN